MLVVLFSLLFGKNNSPDGLMDWKSVPWLRLFMYKTPWYSLVQVLMQLLRVTSKLLSGDGGLCPVLTLAKKILKV